MAFRHATVNFSSPENSGLCTGLAQASKPTDPSLHAILPLVMSFPYIESSILKCHDMSTDKTVPGIADNRSAPATSDPTYQSTRCDIPQYLRSLILKGDTVHKPRDGPCQEYDARACVRFLGRCRVATIHPESTRTMHSLSERTRKAGCFQRAFGSRNVRCSYKWQSRNNYQRNRISLLQRPDI